MSEPDDSTASDGYACGGGAASRQPAPWRVLDLVTPVEEGGRWAVTEVRRYLDGSYKYAVSPVDGQDEPATLWWAAQLRPLGGRAPLALFELEGPFRQRELVRVCADYEEPELAGQVGEVDGYQGGTHAVSVWFDGLGEAVDVREEAVTSTGRRAPAPVLSAEPAQHLTLGPDGQLVGHPCFVVVDLLDAHL